MALQTFINMPVSRQPVWFRLLATPLERLWGVAVALRSLLWDQGVLSPARLPGQTISVGNITVGGTGKSPVVMSLVNLLKDSGRKPAILTRGYGSGLKGHDYICLKNGKVILSGGQEPDQLPDEALMQSLRLPDVPVIASPDRLGAARSCLKHLQLMCDTWVLDDGFQHRKIHRDIDLVLVDYHTMFGNGCYLPRGNLREKPAALDRASFILVTRSPEKSAENSRLAALGEWSSAPCHFVPFVQGTPVCSRDGSPLKKGGQKLYLLAGIAAPERLLPGLDALGLSPDRCYFIGDHESFSKSRHAESVREMSGQGILLTTEKDFNRDRTFFTGLPGIVYILPLEISLPEKALRSFIDSALTAS